MVTLKSFPLEATFIIVTRCVMYPPLLHNLLKEFVTVEEFVTYLCGYNMIMICGCRVLHSVWYTVL